MLLKKLEWFLTDREKETCSTLELREFLAYVRNGHLEPGGRWGNPHSTRPVRPRTVRDYHGHLRTFFKWLVREEILTASPMERIDPPISRSDQITPFTTEQVQKLLAAAKKSKHPKRDEAIMLMLLDTGMRVSELTGLKLADLDLQERRCRVLGKGNKHRSVFFGTSTAKALFNYLRDEGLEKGDYLFRSERGTNAGEGLTRWGVRQIIERAAKVAKIDMARCSPHTFRHTMAVTFLRNGGQTFTLKELLGHTDLKMTQRYVALAEADIASQGRRFSPVDSLKARSTR
jgi:site-specific recombinase XerD